MTLWIKVSNDEYELPEAVAETAKELSIMVGVKEAYIHNAIHHAKIHGWNCCYKRIKVGNKNWT